MHNLFRHPDPSEVRALVDKHDLKGADVARLVGTDEAPRGPGDKRKENIGRTYRRWSGGERKMPVSVWRLLLLLTEEMTVEQMRHEIKPPVETDDYSRGATGFRSLSHDGVAVSYIIGSEGYSGIHSIADERRIGRPAIRVDTSDGTTAPIHDEPDGLIVFGTRKYNRPAPEWVAEKYPEYGFVMDMVAHAIREFDGSSEPS